MSIRHLKPFLFRKFICKTTLVLSIFFFSGTASAEPVDHVFHISVDGLRGDLLQNLVANSPASHPNFIRLQNEGAFTYNARTDFNFTATIPDHGSILTGRPVIQQPGHPNTEHHGITTNRPANGAVIHDGNPNVSYMSSTFDVAHDNGLSTGFYVSKDRLTIYANSYNTANGAPDVIGIDNGTNKIDHVEIENQDTPELMSLLTAQVNISPLNYTFLHLTDPDAAGHSSGWGTQTWNDAVQVTDTQLGTIFSLIDSIEGLQGNTAIVLTADHGGGNPSTSHTDATKFENYNVPLFIWGAGLAAGSDVYDHYSNRFDPGISRPDYNAAEQPLRNGDTANISLALLGLDPVPGSLMIPIATVPTPGDMNNDSKVDATDLQLFLNQYGNNSATSFSEGDFNDDGKTGLADLHLLKQNYTPADSESPAAVPEPNTLWLLLLAMATCWVISRSVKNIREEK